MDMHNGQRLREVCVKVDVAQGSYNSNRKHAAALVRRTRHSTSRPLLTPYNSSGQSVPNQTDFGHGQFAFTVTVPSTDERHRSASRGPVLFRREEMHHRANHGGPQQLC